MTKIALATLLVSIFLLAGCNTVRGMGQDIQRAGGAIEDAARKR